VACRATAPTGLSMAAVASASVAGTTVAGASVAGASVAGTTVTGAAVAYPPGLAHESFLMSSGSRPSGRLLVDR
jgi:hypothetical protein